MECFLSLNIDTSTSDEYILVDLGSLRKWRKIRFFFKHVSLTIESRNVYKCFF